ncbi:PREDICTED: uncharacterized protein LOC107344376 [Acropora digitifera]|uniref:uncharacterized protein LOC107344376 n=1 Tax=Acropora digitifera TaxID=70779 RepID=UPI00077A9014|nr:PREDICTED: uncharacterized protein LOC107344376 [Acropora digitifera]
MMLSDLIPVILVLFLFSTAVEADDTEEDVELLIFNRNTSTKLTKSNVRKVLKKANLTGHGYKKEVSYQRVMSPESTPYFKASYFYYRSENCSRIQEIEEELETLIPGVLGQDVANRVKTELQYWHLDNVDQCKVGLEIVFTGIDTDQRSKRFISSKKVKSVVVGLKVKAKVMISKDVVKGAIKGAIKGARKGIITGGPAGALSGAVIGAVTGGVKAAMKAKPKPPSSGAVKGEVSGAVTGGVIAAMKAKPKPPSSTRRRSSYSSRRRSTSYSSRRRTSYSSRRRSTSYSSRRRTSYSSRRRTSSSSHSGWWGR